MKKCGLLFVFVLVTSCGKYKVDEPKMDLFQEEVIPSLAYKTDEEVLALKYSNDVRLKCELVVEDLKQEDLNQRFTIKNFDWNLVGSLEDSQLLNAKVKNTELQIKVSYFSHLVIQKSLLYTDVNKKKYFMEYSPKVGILIERITTEQTSTGPFSTRSYGSEVTLYENVERSLYKNVSTVEDKPVVNEKLNCKLSTKIKYGYESQWQVIK